MSHWMEKYKSGEWTLNGKDKLSLWWFLSLNETSLFTFILRKNLEGNENYMKMVTFKVKFLIKIIFVEKNLQKISIKATLKSCNILKKNILNYVFLHIKRLCNPRKSSYILLIHPWPYSYEEVIKLPLHYVHKKLLHTYEEFPCNINMHRERDEIFQDTK